MPECLCLNISVFTVSSHPHAQTDIVTISWWTDSRELAVKVFPWIVTTRCGISQNWSAILLLCIEKQIYSWLKEPETFRPLTLYWVWSNDFLSNKKFLVPDCAVCIDTNDVLNLAIVPVSSISSLWKGLLTQVVLVKIVAYFWWSRCDVFFVCLLGSLFVCFLFFPLFKARQMSHYVMVSPWCASLLTNTRFCFFVLEWTVIKLIWCYIKKRSFQMTQGDH